jgi:flagellar biosynthesis protein
LYLITTYSPLKYFAGTMPMADKFDNIDEKASSGELTASNIKKKPKNPVAVAIEDASHKDELPHISAAGRGKIAEQILQLAFDNDVKVREDSALAEMLASFEIDSPIPSDALMAVAEILSYVYRANGEPNPFDSDLRDAMGSKSNKDSENR